MFWDKMRMLYQLLLAFRISIFTSTSALQRLKQTWQISFYPCCCLYKHNPKFKVEMAHDVCQGCLDKYVSEERLSRLRAWTPKLELFCNSRYFPLVHFYEV